MTDTTTRTDPPSPVPPHRVTLPRTAAAARRANAEAAKEAAQRAAEIRRAPGEHKPKLVLSQHVRGESWLDKIADAVNKFCGSMWVFLLITIGIVFWLFAGNIVGFDKTPWPLLLTILNLPQLSIMISLQVSANRAQAASDKRAIADHETLIALHEMGKQQIDVLNGQDTVLGTLHDLGTQQLELLHGQETVLSILNNFACKDLPGRQAEILTDVRQILAAVGQAPAGG
jgi:uncharacterized membrane protein